MATSTSIFPEGNYQCAKYKEDGKIKSLMLHLFNDDLDNNDWLEKKDLEKNENGLSTKWDVKMASIDREKILPPGDYQCSRTKRNGSHGTLDFTLLEDEIYTKETLLKHVIDDMLFRIDDLKDLIELTLEIVRVEGESDDKSEWRVLLVWKEIDLQKIENWVEAQSGK